MNQFTQFIYDHFIFNFNSEIIKDNITNLNDQFLVWFIVANIISVITILCNTIPYLHRLRKKYNFLGILIFFIFDTICYNVLYIIFLNYPFFIMTYMIILLIGVKPFMIVYNDFERISSFGISNSIFNYLEKIDQRAIKINQHKIKYNNLKNYLV